MCQMWPDFLLKKLMVHIQVTAVRFLVLQQVTKQQSPGAVRQFKDVPLPCLAFDVCFFSFGAARVT